MKIILQMLILLTVGGILQFFISTSKKSAEIKNSDKVLSYHKGFVYMGILGFILGTGFLFPWPPVNTGALITKLIVSSVFWISGIYLILSYKNTKIVFNDEKICSFNEFNKKIEMSWSEVKEVKYVKTGSVLVLKSTDKKISISLLIKGIDDFKEVIKRNVPEEIYRKTFMELQSFQA